MNMKEEKICRLCLTVAENDFKIIDEITRDMFEVLLLRVNLDLSKDPIICKDCAEVAAKCFHFKSVCRDTEELIFSYVIDNDGASFKLNDMYRDGKEMESVDDSVMCRFCLNRLSGTNFVSLDILMTDVMFAEMLQLLMSEMNFGIIKRSVICTSCKQELERYIKFAQQCLDVEEKITKYFQSKCTPSSTQVKLSEIVRFSFKNTSDLDHTQIHSIKQEDVSENITETNSWELYDIGIIKAEEEIDIKDEEVNYNETRMLNTKKNLEANIFKCAMCTYESKRKHNLKDHMLIHKNVTEVEMYKCLMCTYETKYKKSLKTHMLIHKDIAELEMYKCSVCTYETKHKWSLKTHMLIHKDITELQMYKCSMCTFESKRKYNFKAHMLIHKNITEVEMYKCSMCTYETKHNSNLKIHLLIHKDITEVEMYKCSKCTFETKRKGDLKRHTIIHKGITEVEMYKCSMCTYQAKHKSNLKNHMLIHKDITLVKMFNCAFCSYKAKHKYYIKRHKCKSLPSNS